VERPLELQVNLIMNVRTRVSRRTACSTNHRNWPYK